MGNRQKTNIGIDLTFFDKLTLNADIFREDREKIFISRNTTPQILGVGTAKENLGKVRNEGFEIEAGYRDVVNRNFSWFVSGMFSYSKTRFSTRTRSNPNTNTCVRPASRSASISDTRSCATTCPTTSPQSTACAC